MSLNDPHLFWLLIAGCSGLFLVVSGFLVILPMCNKNIKNIPEIRSLIFVQVLIGLMVIIPIVIGGTVYLLVLGAVLARGVWEIHELIFGLKMHKKSILILCLPCFIFPFLVFDTGPAAHALMAVGICILSIVLAPRHHLGFHIAALSVLMMSVEALLLLEQAENAVMLITLIYLIVEVFDSFSYLIGRLFGHHKVFRKISPGKTWEGYIGGLICVSIFATTLNYFIYQIAWDKYFAWVVILLIAGVSGDILTSLFKRRFGRKDFSPLIVIHGGLLDIYDAFFFAVIIFSVMYFI